MIASVEQQTTKKKRPDSIKQSSLSGQTSDLKFPFSNVICHSWVPIWGSDDNFTNYNFNNIYNFKNSPWISPLWRCISSFSNDMFLYVCLRPWPRTPERRPVSRCCIYTCVYMYVYTYVYIYIYMYLFIYLYTYLHISILSLSLSLSISLSLYIYIYIYIYMYIHKTRLWPWTPELRPVAAAPLPVVDRMSYVLHLLQLLLVFSKRLRRSYTRPCPRWLVEHLPCSKAI